MLKQKYQLPIVSTGAILREEQRRGTAVGRAADAITRSGGLLPDPTILSLVQTWLAANNGEFVFDGFPRTVNQARSFDTLLEERGTPLELVIALEADLPTLQDRVTRRLVCTQCRAIVRTGLHVADITTPCPVCGGTLVRRADDTIETLTHRMVEYHEKTEPLVGYYLERGLLRKVPSMEKPEQVFARIAPLIEAV
jgi:adenylate kinase